MNVISVKSPQDCRFWKGMGMNPKHFSTEQALLDRGWTSKDGLWWPPDGPWNLNGISFVNALAWEAHRAQNSSQTNCCPEEES